MAASTDATGASELGGDWDLEYQIGSIEANIPLNVDGYTGLLSTFTVTTTLDSGGGSLRQAILDANANFGPDVIDFNIPGVGPHTISPLSALPDITDPIVIDGFAQPGASPNTNPAGAGKNTVLLIAVGNTGLPGSTLVVSAGNSTIRGLAISGKTTSILLTGGDNNVIEGNFIATDITGTVLQSGRINVLNSSTDNIIGGTDPAAGNVIGSEIGLLQSSDRTTIQGNFIGVDVTGTVALGFAGIGIVVDTQDNTIGGTTEGARNVISGNGTRGIQLNQFGDGNDIQGNYIGTDVTGTQDLGNGDSGILVLSSSDNNVIGGTAPGAGNVISGNGSSDAVGDGILMFTTNNTIIQGNYIGTDATGTFPLGNSGRGIQIGAIGTANGNLIGGTTPGAGNIISANGKQGITGSWFDGSGNTIQGNWIGTDKMGTLDLGNGDVGVTIGSNMTLGGISEAAGNTIAFNFFGVWVSGGSDNVIQSNSIFRNDDCGVVVRDGGINNTISQNAIFSNNVTLPDGGLGIDLDQDGATSNDLGDFDLGSNKRQNFPVIASAITSANGSTIIGTLNSKSNTPFTLEFFASEAADPSGHGEGETFLGSTTVITDSGGNVSFGFGYTPVVGQSVITATATDPAGNTSEFSAAVTETIATTTVSLVGNDLKIEDTDGADTNDTLTLSVSDTDLVISDPNNLIATSIGTGDGTNTVTVDLLSFTGNVIVNTLAGNDSVTFDSTFDIGGMRGVILDAGDGTDSVTWDATAALASLALTAETINLNSGAVNTGIGNQTYKGTVLLDGQSLIAYEPFDYDVGALAGKLGGTGWGGAWSSGGGLVEASGLAYPAGESDGGLPATGKHFRSSPNQLNFRALAATYGDVAGASTFEFSGLINSVDLTNGLIQPHVITGGVGAVGLIGSSFLGAASGNWHLKSGSTFVDSSVPIVNGETIHFILQIDSTGDGADDTVSLWINPGPTLGAPDATSSSQNIGSFNTIRLRAQVVSEYQADEIQVRAGLLTTQLSGGDIVFDGTVDAAAGETAGLQINASGDVEFNDVVGGMNILESIKVDSTGGTVDINAAINVGAGGLDIDPPDTINVSAPINSAGGPINLTANNNIIADANGDVATSGGLVTLTPNADGVGGGSISWLGNVDFGNGGGLTVNNSGTGSLTALVTGTGNVTVGGSGTLTFGNAGNNYIGGTNLQGSATLGLAAANVIPNGSDLTMADTATLDLNGKNETILRLTGAAGNVITTSIGGSVVLTTRTAAITTTFAGVIEDGGGTVGLTRTGLSGTLVLSGNNTATGTLGGQDNGLTVVDGTWSGNATQPFGSEFGGSGTVTGDGNFSTQGVLTPGNDGPGILTFGGNLNQGSSLSYLNVELDGGAVAGLVNGYDQVVVGGNASLGVDTALRLNLTDLTAGELFAGQDFLILDNAGSNPVIDTFRRLQINNGPLNTGNLLEGDTIVTNLAGSGLNLNITYQGGVGGNDIVLSVVSPNTAPEIAAQSFNADENQTAVGKVTATDPDLPADTQTFSISGGPDAAKFNITAGGVLTFAAAPDFENPTDLGGTVGDNIYLVEVEVEDAAGETDTATMTVTVTPVNDNAPVFTSAATENVPENTTAVQTISATDADLPAQTVTFSITGGADELKFQITGGNQLSFIAAPDFEIPTDIGANNVYEVEVTADDNSGLTTPQTVSVTVTPVNDEPLNTVPGAQTVAEDAALPITGISVSDVDVDETSSPNNTVQVALSVNDGTLLLAGTSGLTGDTDGSDGLLSITGTLVDVNAALATVTYQGTLDFNGSDTLTVTTNDLGHTGSGGVLSDLDTVAITITVISNASLGDFVFEDLDGDGIQGPGELGINGVKVNLYLDDGDGIAEPLDTNTDPGPVTIPSFTSPVTTTLLISTHGDVASPSGVPGLGSWTAGELLEFADPNLALEPGTTAGTLSSLFDYSAFALDGSANIRGAHFVSTDITVGSGSNTFDLKVGDLVLATLNDETLTSSNTLSVTDDDVFVFRPNTAGDYSSGIFTMLLDDPAGGKRIHTISLVESDTTVGDVTLLAGSFLLSHSGREIHNKLFLYTADEVGAGTTTGTKSIFIDGSDIGFTDQVQGTELIESSTTIGGVTLDAGTILLTLNNTNTSVGDNGISVDEHDIFYLNVTTTGSGTTAADATLLFEGSDVGLDTSSEDLNALTLITGAGAGVGPVLDLNGTGAGTDFAATFTEAGGPVAIVDSDATLTDADSTNLDSLTVGIANLLDGTAETLSADVSGTSITASYDSLTGELTLRYRHGGQLPAGAANRHLRQHRSVGQH